MTLTVARLKEVISYDPETGVFIWLMKPANRSNRMKVGEHAGHICRNSGYRLIGIDGRVYKASRLAWFYMTDEWPKIVDHANCNRLDDRWANLRKATQAQNLQNRGAQKNNTSGFKGVSSYDGKRWCARVVVQGKVFRKNGFSTPAEAALWYAQMASKMHGEFARTQ